MSRKRKKYAADFEATTEEKDCRVWGWGFRDINDLDRHRIGHSMEDFMNFLLSSKNADFYFHNLKYDGSFILNYLFKSGFTFDRDSHPKEKTFQTTISDMGAWYKIDITLGYDKKGSRIHVDVYDSLKKLPFKIKEIAKAFKLPVVKGEIDYKKERPIGYRMTEEEKSYINNDVEILARALKIQFDQGLTGMTIGQDAMSDYKKRVDRDTFKKLFPVLDYDTDAAIRKSYKGGYTYLNPLHANEVIYNGKVFDVNSLYPWAMRYCLLPYGTPIYFKGKPKTSEKYPLYTVRFRCEFTLKENHLPTVQIKNSGRFVDTEYLSSTNNEPVELNMTSTDFKLFSDHYHIDGEIEWLDGYKYKAKHSMFDDYIDYWTEKKVNSAPFLPNGEINPNANPQIYTLSKLMLNNLYGKFGKSPKVTPKIPVFDNENKKLSFENPVDDEGYEVDEIDDPVYIPMGAFITAYAREKTIRTAQKCYARFVYADTDSIHITGFETPEVIKDEINASELGYWKHEGDFVKAKFIRQKTYVEVYKTNKFKPVKANLKRGLIKLTVKNKIQLHIQTNFHYDFKCAGMPDTIKETLTFETFRLGFHAPTGKLLPKQVENGVVLIDSSYTLK